MDLEARPEECKKNAFAPTGDLNWVLIEEGFNLAREHEIESLFAISNGYIGTRASLAEGSSLSAPATFVAGVYDVPTSGAVPQLAAAPDWMQLRGYIDGNQIRLEGSNSLSHSRILDMRQGIFWRDWRFEDPSGRVTHIRGLRLVSLANRHLLMQIVFFTPENYSGRIDIEPTITPPLACGDHVERVTTVQAALPRVFASSPVVLEFRTRTGIKIGFATDSRARIEGGDWLRPIVRRNHEGERWAFSVRMATTYRLERIVAVYTSRETSRPTDAALERLQQALGQSGDALLAAHVQAWQDRWHWGDVEIDGDDDAQRAVRFACYHLTSAANPEDDRVSIGARALTGPAYKGHVFWDTEIFMLPFYIFTHPPSARSVLMYRYHTLDAAREKARRLGYCGALYAWESADTGKETTPPYVIRPDGTVRRIWSGELEHHISADVAYAVWQYWHVTGDDEFLLQAGAEIMLETARFWGNRVVTGADGLQHIPEVVGPDEYHEGVDDNAFTNTMAQWNLEQGVATAKLLAERWPRQWQALAERLGIGDGEIQDWQRIARQLYVGQDPQRGLLEQFKGYFDLQYIDLAEYAQRNVSMDVLLGADRIRQSQVIKQADVLMLFYLLGDRFAPRIQAANFRYYEARCGHGSSLSPCVHALIAARLGYTDIAMAYFRQAAEIDLANNMGNAAGGVHAAALGGLWQAAVFGFGGVAVGRGGFTLAPHLPSEWQALRFRIFWRGQTVHFSIRTSGIEVALSDGTEGVAVTVGEALPVCVAPGQTVHWKRYGAEWVVAP